MSKKLEILAVAAAVLGLILEWRRDSRREDEHKQTQARVTNLEAQVQALNEWHNRTARAQ